MRVSAGSGDDANAASGLYRRRARAGIATALLQKAVAGRDVRRAGARTRFERAGWRIARFASSSVPEGTAVQDDGEGILSRDGGTE
jgi:hypothetical protein